MGLIPPRLLPLLLLAPAMALGAAPTYDFPPQPGREKLAETDPARALLTDGTKGFRGPEAVWGGWGIPSVAVDWTFPEPAELAAVTVTIVHPNPASDASHVGTVRFYGSDGGAFQAEPDFSAAVPFEEGRLQTARIALPPGLERVRALRTVFVAARQQAVVCEVAFESSPSSSADVRAAQAAREAAQPERFAPVPFPPAPLPAGLAPVPPRSIFGVCGHMIHTDFFYPAAPGAKTAFGPAWRVENTLPYVAGGNLGWVREPLYGNLFAGEPDRRAPNGRAVAENRAEFERGVAAYEGRGVRVMLTPMFGGLDGAGLASYAAWLGGLARRHPNVRAVELHNEPNLRGFWKGTPQEFVAAATAFAQALRQADPDVSVVAGSFSGWGGAFNDEGLKALVSGPRELATKWAEEAFRLGLLSVADAVSAHPYRGRSAPEGGESLESPSDPEGFAKEIAGWLRMADGADARKRSLPFYLTEIGYSVSLSGYSTVPGEARQADYLSRLMVFLFGLRTQGTPLEAVFWYDLKQDERPDDPYEANFGLVSPDGSRPRPAYLAYRRVAGFFADPAAFQPLAGRPAFSNGDGLVQARAWRRAPDGALVVAYWRLNQLQKRDADFASELALPLPAGFRPSAVTLWDLHEDAPRPVGYTADGGTLRVPVNVTARAAWIVAEP